MRNKVLILITIVFFLLVNSTYYWEGKLGFFAFPTFFILVIVYIGLSIALLQQIILSFKEKFYDRKRVILILIILTVLIISFLKPRGLINFDKFSGTDILIAQREGSANCMTTFKLKENNTFIETNICFGVSQTNGNYRLLNDTIFFYDVIMPRHQKEYFEFATNRPSKLKLYNNKYDLVRFKNKADTVGHSLWIIKNGIKENK